MTGFVAVTSLSQCEQRFNKTDGINRDKIQANAKRFIIRKHRPSPLHRAESKRRIIGLRICRSIVQQIINRRWRLLGIRIAVLSRCWLLLNAIVQEAQLSPSDRAMRLSSSNLANYHATVQKLLIRQVLTKPMAWSWRFSWRQCVINVYTQPRRDRVALIVSGVIKKPTTDELCISPVYRRLAVMKFSKSTM